MTQRARRFDRHFKLAALARIGAGENVTALGPEFGVRRRLLCQWCETGRPATGGERLAATVERSRLGAPQGWRWCRTS
jgi:transposase-like protein